MQFLTGLKGARHTADELFRGQYLYSSVGFLPGFPGSPGRAALAHFQEAGWNRPLPLARLYGPSAEEQAPFVLHNATDHLTAQLSTICISSCDAAGSR